MAAQVKAMMDGPLTINQKVNQVIDLLEAHGLAHKVVLRPSQILCHPDNRGGTMVSYHDAWTKGMAMLGVGIQISLLQGSIAIEMSKDEAKRKVQVSKNEQWFHEANGHLAPLSGQERSLPISMVYMKPFFEAPIKTSILHILISNLFAIQ